MQRRIKCGIFLRGDAGVIVSIAFIKKVDRMLRSIFAPDEDPEYWRTAMEEFPNKVPRFQTKEEAVQFMERYCKIGSNPDEPQLRQSISTLTTWAQIEKYLLPKFAEYQSKWPAVPVPPPSSLAGNRYSSATDTIAAAPADVPPTGRPVLDFLTSRLDLPIHSAVTTASAENTLHYLFHHLRCGILVMIRNNQVVIFCPFVNKHYTNTWESELQLQSSDGQVDTYFAEKEQHCRKENYLPDKAQWWANGNIICNEICKPGKEQESQWWGDQFLFQLKDMLAETCKHRTVPDCEFFLNKRDYPQLKFNAEQLGQPVEPYGFIYNRDDRDPQQDVPLSRHLYKSYAPILSFYTSSRFADIPFPPSEDWEAATGVVFPPSMNFALEGGSDKPVVAAPRDLFTEANLKKFERPWAEKVPIAFFRGTATGGGTTVQTNQRLHIAQLCWEWDKDPALSGKAGGANEAGAEAGGLKGKDPSCFPYLDAKITGWNMRDKKVSSGKMTYVRKTDFPFHGDRATNFVEIYKQSTYKYLIYIEGHCAACRYGFMMQLGSVILKVESSCVAGEMWYFPLLRPYHDHVPVKADMSDLQEKIEWCRTHDDECRAIAANAGQLYKQFVSREAILDYMQTICVEIAKRYRHPPEWARGPRPPTAPPIARGRPTGVCPADCSTCAALVSAQREAERDLSFSSKSAAAASLASQDKKSANEKLRDRMKRKAQEEKLISERLEEAMATKKANAGVPVSPPPAAAAAAPAAAPAAQAKGNVTAVNKEKETKGRKKQTEVKEKEGSPVAPAAKRAKR